MTSRTVHMAVVGLVVSLAATQARAEHVVLLANEAVFPEIEPEVERLATDLQDEGYTTEILVSATNNAETLWNLIAAEYADDVNPLVGVILLGNLPNGRATVGSSSYTTDAVYWNMNAYGVTGIRDIWVSRIKGSVREMKWALDASHFYRTGASRLPHSAAYIMHAYPESEPYYYPGEGANALDVWPEVAEAEFISDWFGQRFAIWQTGGELLDETMHGSAFRSKVARHAGHPNQTRFNMVTSCSAASAAWQLSVTRGGGGVFSVGATTTTYTGAFVILDNSSQDHAFRDLLAQGHSWGDALVGSHPFNDVYRAMYYGDLSLPALASPSNTPPVVHVFTGDPVTGPAPLTVDFTVDASDGDGDITLHEWFPEGYRQNLVVQEPTYNNLSSTQSHTYAWPHRYAAEILVMDNFLARNWPEPVVVAVSPTPGAELRINCGKSSSYAVPEFDYEDGDGNMWLHDQDFKNDGTWGYQTSRSRTYQMGGDIQGTDDEAVYGPYRAAPADYPFTYRIPMASGRYTVTLGFAEPSTETLAGERLIDVSIEGDPWLVGYDILAHAGAARTAVTAEASIELTDGELTLEVSRNLGSTLDAVLSWVSIEPEACDPPCNDGLFCNGMEVCQAGGSCASGTPPCVDDGLSCTLTCDEASHTCNVPEPGTCIIDGGCFLAGAANPVNPCQECAPALATNAWSATDGGTCDDGIWCNGTDVCDAGNCVHENEPCVDDELSCTTTCDEASDTCNAVQPGHCAIESTCYAAGAPHPENACQACLPELSDHSWSPNDSGSCDDGVWCNGAEHCGGGACLSGTEPCLDDGLSCTDTCDEGTTTCNVLGAESCLIAGECFTEGDANPSNPCQACRSASHAHQWSNDDTLTCDDGNACTAPDTCSAGVCESVPLVGCCTSPADCDDGKPCTDDVCNTDDGTCTNPLPADKCLIGVNCYEGGQANPDNACETCDPLGSQTAFSAMADGSPCDDRLFCSDGDVCEAGVCAGATARDCDDDLACTMNQCDEASDECTTDLSDDWCLLDGACAPLEDCNEGVDDEPADDGTSADANPDVVGSCSGSGRESPGGFLLVLLVLWQLRRPTRATPCSGARTRA